MNFSILGSGVKSDALVNFFMVIGYSYIVMPALTLLLWGVFVIKDVSDKGDAMDYTNFEFVGGISVFLLGIAVALFVTALTKISWNNYRLKLTHTVFFMVAYALFTAWQFLQMFHAIDEDFSYLSISMVFLTQSGIFLTILVYQNLYENKFNLIYFLDKFMDKDGEAQDPKREDDFLEEINEQKSDPDWMPSMYDIFDIITIGQVSNSKMMNVLGRGLQRIAMDNSLDLKYLINGIFLFLYLGSLTLYAIMVHHKGEGSNMGILCAILVVINDGYMYLMYNARIIKRISLLALITFGSRFFLIVGEEKYWIFGNLAVYVCLECIITLGIVQRRLPYSGEVDTNKASNVDPLKAGKKGNQTLDLARVPEFVFLVLTVVMAMTTEITRSMEIKGSKLTDLPLGDVREGLAPDSAMLIAILFVMTFLCFWTWLRAFNRKLEGTNNNVYVFLWDRRVDLYFIMSGVVYLLAVFWAFILYRFFDDDKAVLVNGLGVPLITLLFLNIVVIYVRNNHFYLEDIDGINRAIAAHNKRADAIKLKGRELSKKMMREGGPESVYGEENGKLVEKVMQAELTRR